nr:MAG TPA: hypothetical protein [Caudoviricetes sp.]
MSGFRSGNSFTKPLVIFLLRWRSSPCSQW